MGKSLICIFLALLGMGLSAWLRKEEQGSGASFRAVQPEITTQQWEKVETLEWPLMLGDSGLLALEMRAYDGPFLEDGSHDPVVGVAALMVKNVGERDISSAMITVEQGGRRLHFFLTWLPAGEQVLVLEWERAAYMPGQVTACVETGVRWETFWTDGIRVETTDGEWLVTNAGGVGARNVRLRYKWYVDGYYLGGITYCAPVGDLASGESQEVSKLEMARVVAVLADAGGKK